MNANGRTWEENADEFRALDEGKGWPFAKLVACSVEKGKGGPRTVAITTVKVSARDFAERAGCSADRVLRYLATWDKAAAKGDAKYADELEPWSVDFTMDPDTPFDDLYDASRAGGRPRDSKATDVAKIVDLRGAEEIVAALTSEQRQEVVREVIKMDPVAAEVADLAVSARVDPDHDITVLDAALAAVLGSVGQMVHRRAKKRAEELVRTGAPWEEACSQAAAEARRDADIAADHERERKRLEAEEAGRPTPALFVIDAVIKMVTAVEKALDSLPDQARVAQFSDAELAMLTRECDRAQGLLDYLRDTPNREEITPEAIIGEVG